MLPLFRLLTKLTLPIPIYVLLFMLWHKSSKEKRVSLSINNLVIVVLGLVCSTRLTDRSGNFVARLTYEVWGLISLAAIFCFLAVEIISIVERTEYKNQTDDSEN